MATDYNLDKPKLWPPKTGGSFNFTYDHRADVEPGLKIMLACADQLFDSQKLMEIKLDAGVTGRMLEVMGLLLMRAAHLPEDRRALMFVRWAEQGPILIDEMIERAKAREGRLVVRDDVSMFMGCPDGYEI
jgi:hypothetical protein